MVSLIRLVAKRSPILGYNHNIRHRGLVFHVQTEDSGLANPHIFTHLFHGGTILSTRKLVYDPEAADEVVKALMQAQHKAVLKELKDGKFTDKINLYLGKHPDLLPFDPAAETSERTEPMSRIAIEDLTSAPIPSAPAPAPELQDTDVTIPMASAATQDVTEPVLLLRSEDTKRDRPPMRPQPPASPPAEVATIHSPAPPSAPEPPGLEKSGAYAQHRRERSRADSPLPTVTFTPPPASADPPPRPPRPPPPPPPRPGRAAVPQPAPAGKSGGVVVSRPAVIVGAPPRVVGGSTSKTTQRAKPDAGSRKSDALFGQGLISEKSLDEVILAYLSEDGEDE